MKKILTLLITSFCLFNAVGKVIDFDKISGNSDTERLKQLPALIKKEIKNFGIKYSLRGKNPQPAYLFTVVRVEFSNRIYDFASLKKAVDLGHCFELVGVGRPVFKCGINGFIKFSQRKTVISNISFAGPRNKVPPIVIYAAQEKGLGTEADAGNIVIRDCYFKGFSIVMRSKDKQHTNSALLKIDNCVFYNCFQLSDRLKFDGTLITGSWLCPTFTSDKAFIVNYGSMVFQNNLCVPQADAVPLKNVRWFDNYGLNLCILSSRFGNETINKKNPLYAEQVSLVYNYRKYRTSSKGRSIEFELDRNALIIRDNILYARNVPVIKLFEFPNHISVSGNTGMIGKIIKIKENTVHDTTVMFGIKSLRNIPTVKDKKFISIFVKDNNKKIKLYSNKEPVSKIIKSIMNN